MRLERGPDEPIGGTARPFDLELLEQERERLLQIRADRRADLRRQIPELPLEWADRLLATLIDELLFGVTLLPFVLALDLGPLVDLVAQVGRQLGVIEHDRLKVRREVDFDGFALGEISERVGRQRRRAVLYRPAQPVLGAGVVRQRLERLEIE